MLKLIVCLFFAGVLAQSALFSEDDLQYPNFKNPEPIDDSFFDADLAEEAAEMVDCKHHTTRKHRTTTTGYEDTTTRETDTTTTRESEATTTTRDSGSHPDGDYCVSATCIKTASDLIQSMNTTVDPCEDFYEYACGSWGVNNVIPYWKGEYGTFFRLGDDVFYQTMDLMKLPIKSSEAGAIHKVKNQFAACMNEDLIDTLGGKPVLDLMKRFGGWPVLGNFVESRFNFEDMMADMNLLGFEAVVGHGVWAGYHDNKRNYFQLDQAPLNMKREYLIDSKYDSYVTLYRTFAHEMAQALGAHASDTKKQMDDMVDFEIALAKLNAPVSQRQDWPSIYQKMTLDHFNSYVTNKFDLKRYINRQLAAVGKPGLRGNDHIISWAKPSFFQGLGSLIKRTPKKTIANYMMFNFVYYTVGFLSPTQFAAIVDRFVKPIWGSSGSYMRDSSCSWSVSQDMGWAAGRMFVDAYFDKDAKNVAGEMIESLRATFIEMLGSLKWMDASARKTAVEKAAAIHKMIGYPDEIMDNVQLDRIYELVEAKNDEYYNNLISVWASGAKGALKTCGDLINKHGYASWIVMPTVVNAFYSPTGNSISFPAAILQPPFYHKDHPKYLNFAGIGYVMGHELTHGFDNSGKEYDLNGNHRQWWPKDVIARYTQKAQCFVEQYNNYYVPEVKRYVNGKLTLNENLADNGGILQSFTTYSKIAKKLGHREQKLPGLGLSNEQVFYLNAAQVWCGKVLTKGAWDWDLKEVHSPGRYRVWGSMSNSDDFAKTFNCRKGTKMNPRKTCALWV